MLRRAHLSAKKSARRKDLFLPVLSIMQKYILFLLLLLSVSLFSCSNRPPGMPVLYPCKITVIQGEAPLADATVILINVSDIATGQAWAPMGKTNSSGVAVMMTNAQYSGAAAGKYQIIVEKRDMEPSKLGPPPAADSPEYDAWSEKRANEDLALLTLIDEVYSSSKTPHEIEVGKGPNEKTIDVGKAVRIKM